jgi:hypothetical protein
MRDNLFLKQGPSDAERKPNEEVAGIIQELEELASDPSSDAFILFLYSYPHAMIDVDSGQPEYETIKQTMPFSHCY